MREQLSASMKARDSVRTQFLRYWIAQLTRGDGTEVPDDEAIKRMRGILKEATTSVTSFGEQEIELLREWVPRNLTREQIDEALSSVAAEIRGAGKEGMAMGIAMKALAGRAVDSEDVRAVVAALRG
jgi:uncharacterized protein YqeY